MSAASSSAAEARPPEFRGPHDSIDNDITNTSMINDNRHTNNDNDHDNIDDTTTTTATTTIMIITTTTTTTNNTNHNGHNNSNNHDHHNNHNKHNKNNNKASYIGVCEQNTPVRQAFDLQSFGRNCSPAPD